MSVDLGVNPDLESGVLVLDFWGLRAESGGRGLRMTQCGDENEPR